MQATAQTLTTQDGQIIGLDGQVMDVKGIAWCKHTAALKLCVFACSASFFHLCHCSCIAS